MNFNKFEVEKRPIAQKRGQSEYFNFPLAGYLISPKLAIAATVFYFSFPDRRMLKISHRPNRQATAKRTLLRTDT